MTLAVFNPWHDMALANGTPNYQPPLSARTMAEELSHLAELWREEGKVTVWGWDPLVVHILCKQGVPREMMPSDEELAEIRRLSSRQTAVRALAEMSTRFESRWCESESDARMAIKEFGDALLKSPWSCSGKGLMHFTAKQLEHDDANINWMRNIIGRQGGIVVEPFYADKEHDFAFEYETVEGHTQYLGISAFSTIDGTYMGNILDTEERKRRHIGLGVDAMQALIARHTAFLDREVAPHYSGPIGIDMMKMNDGSVHPCVEINLRRTMGWVSLQLEKNTPLPASFSIRPGKHYLAVVERVAATPAGISTV